jgi:hypothetical protein
MVIGVMTSDLHANAGFDDLKGPDGSCANQIMHLARTFMKEGMLTNYYCPFVGENFVSAVLSTLHSILSSSNFNILGVFELPAEMKTLLIFEQQDSLIQ